MSAAYRPDEYATPTTEAELCAGFIDHIRKMGKWEAYPETGGFDVLLARKADGVQIGIEAKLSLNVKVLHQIIPRYRGDEPVGPDYRAVLVPTGKVQVGLSDIAYWLGVTVLTFGVTMTVYRQHHFGVRPDLPTQRWVQDSDWHEWCPEARVPLPDYMPDVAAGKPAPVALTTWKVKAIKIAIILEERPVTRADFRVLQIDPSRWMDRSYGWLEPTPQGYVPRVGRMPDFKAQHPTNYEQIKADREKWWPKAGSQK